jgi:hypothetical protein
LLANSTTSPRSTRRRMPGNKHMTGRHLLRC